MKVKVPDTSEQVVVEMISPFESGDLGHIAEMATDAARLDTFVPGASAKAQALAQASGDESPEFPVIRIEEQWSNNQRLWDGQELDNIAAQVNAEQPVGHWGHPNLNNLGWEAPDPQTTWVAATTKDEPSQMKDRLGQQVRVIYLAGYNLPGAKIRTNIKAKAVRGVSWLCGPGSKQIPVPGKGVQMRDVKVLCIDWARKLAEGMSSTALVAVTSEMKGEAVDIDITKLTPAQLAEHNPNLVTLIKNEGASEGQQAVAEMEAKVEAASGDTSLIAKIREALGVDENTDLLTTIMALKEKGAEFTKEVFEGLLDKVLGEKVSDEKARPAIRRLIVGATPVAEQSKFNTEELVAEMVGKSFEEDEVIRDLVSEATPGRAVARREQLRGEGGSQHKHVVAGVAKV